MSITVKFLVGFFVVYVLFKGFLFWRLQVALRRLADRQRALKDRPTFDATLQRDRAGEPPRSLEL